MSRGRQGWALVASTPVILLITHYVAVLPHEFTHSILAWALGIKADPWNIDWGGSSVLNVLLLLHIDENVDYQSALAAGRQLVVAVVALSGPFLANGGLYLLFRRLTAAHAVRTRPVVAYVVLFLTLMNLANIWCYIPIRAFAEDGDMHHFDLATGAPPWVLYVVVGYLVLWDLVDFYRTVLPRSLDDALVGARPARATVLVVASLVIFGYFAVPGLLESDPASLVISGTSLMVVPVVVLMGWRRTVPAD